ncbi:MAG: hypothetical protein B6I26_03270 [Desulfobacteraceae bacterium 4572_130]|nr:MAG: hypothetical protein B6I26_03270 [Desulfobacteraceae bacterium 4572_130]
MKHKILIIITIICLCFVLSIPDIAFSEDIKWHKSYEKGLLSAKKQGKNIFVYFNADWCFYCKKMESTTLKDPLVVKYLNDNFISIFINEKKHKKIISLYNVKRFPVSWFLKKDSSKIGSIPGYLNGEKFLPVLKHVKENS